MTISRDDRSAEKVQRYMLIGLTIALLGWGIFLAIGSFFGGANLQDSIRRGLVVFGCVSGFLAFWWILLLMRRRTLRKAASDLQSESMKRPT